MVGLVGALVVGLKVDGRVVGLMVGALVVGCRVGGRDVGFCVGLRVGVPETGLSE